VRILEFPRYASFAQSFPNTIPYSESIGFIANLKDEKDIDYVFYITAHEVAHQWWAHQVIGGDVQGATVMSETMSQYSALMVMEKEYGRDKMNKFLKYELDRYLRSRGSELLKEQPLILNENQPYIHYNKGSVVMYALRDYIGEEALNAALAKYIKAVAYQEPPYTTSLEFLSYIREATPDSLQYILTDMFETITLYENKAEKASFTQTPDGKYKGALTVKAKKLRADTLGVETEILINDWIDVGVLGKDEKELYLKKYKINQPEMAFEIVVDEEPVEAGIDPYVKLVDRNPDDNVKKMK
jgi:aminopeptidase N